MLRATLRRQPALSRHGFDSGFRTLQEELCDFLPPFRFGSGHRMNNTLPKNSNCSGKAFQSVRLFAVRSAYPASKTKH
jgi:hypothetical protein